MAKKKTKRDLMHELGVVHQALADARAARARLDSELAALWWRVENLEHELDCLRRITGEAIGKVLTQWTPPPPPHPCGERADPDVVIRSMAAALAGVPGCTPVIGDFLRGSAKADRRA